MNFFQFQKFIPKIANSLGMTNQLAGAHVCFLARQILIEINPELASCSKVLSYSKECLTIIGDNTTVLNELHYAQTQLLNSLNEQLKTKSTLRVTKCKFLLQSS